MATENFLINVGMNVNGVKKGFEEVANAARKLDEEVRNLPPPKLTPFEIPANTPASEAGEIFGARRASVQEQQRLRATKAGFSDEQIGQAVNLAKKAADKELNDYLSELELTTKQQELFKSYVTRAAKEYRNIFSEVGSQAGIIAATGEASQAVLGLEQRRAEALQAAAGKVSSSSADDAGGNGGEKLELSQEELARELREQLPEWARQSANNRLVGDVISRLIQGYEEIIRSQALMQVSNLEFANKVNEAARATEGYINSVIVQATESAKENAAVRNALAQDDELNAQLVAEGITSGTARNERNQAIQEDPGFAASKRALDLSRDKQTKAAAALALADEELAARTTELSTLRRVAGADQAEIQAADDRFIEATARAERARLELSRSTYEVNRADEAYQKSILEFAARKRADSVNDKTLIAATKEVQEAERNRAVVLRQLSALSAAELAQNQQYIEASAQLKIATDRQKVAALEYIASNKDLSEEQRELQAVLAAARLSANTDAKFSPEAIEARSIRKYNEKVEELLRYAELHSLEARQSAIESGNISEVQKEIYRLQDEQREIRRRENAAKRAEGAATASTVKLTLEEQALQKAKTNTQKQIVTDLAQQYQFEQSTSKEALRARAAKIVAEKALASEYNRQLAAEVRRQGGGFSQTVRTRLGFEGSFDSTGAGGRGGGIAGQGFFAGGALTSLRYGLPSAALYGGARQFKEAIEDAEELERLLAQLDNQLTSTLGPTQARQEFDRLKEIIKDTSREVGLAGAEVAQLAIQFQGAFGEGSGRNIGGLEGLELVEAQIEAASQFARISGLDDEVVFDDFAAASIAFEATATEIADVAFATQDAVGVSSDEIIAFLARIGPVAQAAGFSLEEFASIGAAANQASGASADVLAENFGRIIPGISEARVELLEFASANEVLNNQEFLDAIATDNVDDIIKLLIRDYGELDKTAQAALVNLIASDREAQTLLALFENSNGYENALEQTADAAGRLDDRFQAFSGTFGQQLARLSQSFRQLLLALLDAGLSDLISEILEAIIGMVDASRDVTEAFVAMASPLSPLLDIIKSLNSLLDGMPVKIALIGAAFKAAGIGGALSAGISALGTIDYFGDRSADRNRYRYDTLAGPIAPGDTKVRGQSRFRQSVNQNVSSASAAVLGLGSVAQLYSTVTDTQDGIEQQVIELQEKLVDLSNEELEAFINDANNSYSGVSGFFQSNILRLPSPADAAQAVLDRRNFEQEAGDFLELVNIDDGLQEFIDYINSDERAVSFTDAIMSQIENGEFTGRQLENVNQVLNADVFTFDPGGGNYNNVAENVEFNAELFKNEEFIQNLIEQAEAGEAEALAFLDLFNRALDNESIAEAIRLLLEDRGTALTRAAQEVVESQASLEEVQAAFEINEASAAAVIAAFDNAITINQTAIDSAIAEGEDEAAEAFIQGNQELKKQEAEFYAETALAQVELINNVIATRDGQGTVDTISGEIDSYVALLRDPEFTDSESRLKVAEKLIELQEAFAQASIDSTEDSAEAIRLATEGIPVIPEVQVEIIRSQLSRNNTLFGAYADAYMALFGGTIESMSDSLAQMIAISGSVAEGTERYLRAQLAGINDQIEFLQLDAGINGNDNSDELEGLLDIRDQIIDDLAGGDNPYGLENLDSIGGNADDAEKAAEQAADDARKAAEEREKAAQDLLDAQNELALALVSGDPVRTAQEQIRQAQEAYAQAETEAERIRAQIQILEGERALEDAMEAVNDSRIDLLIAMANAGGDTVEAARLEAERARAKANELAAEFAAGNPNVGEAEVNSAEIAAISAEASQRDAELDKQREDYEYLYEIDQISKQQLIAYLQQLKSVPGRTDEQLRDLDRRIRELNNELGQDLQFNLPTQLALPTLYEARRLNQSTGVVGGSSSVTSSVGYQDNRQISVELVVNGNTDPEELVDMLDQYLGNDRSTASARRY